jgi:hypothetical protein
MADDLCALMIKTNGGTFSYLIKKIIVDVIGIDGKEVDTVVHLWMINRRKMIYRLHLIV